MLKVMDGDLSSVTSPQGLGVAGMNKVLSHDNVGVQTVGNGIKDEKIQQVLKSQGIVDERARQSFSQDLSKWAARFELWAGELTGIDTEDVASAAKSFGR